MSIRRLKESRHDILARAVLAAVSQGYPFNKTPPNGLKVEEHIRRWKDRDHKTTLERFILFNEFLKSRKTETPFVAQLDFIVGEAINHV